MTVLMNQTMPTGVPIEMIDEVTEEMGVKGDPPPGLLVHVHYEDGGRTCITDVWESEKDYESFREQRLAPAMEKVAAAHGMDLSQLEQPQTVLVAVHDAVRGG